MLGCRQAAQANMGHGSPGALWSLTVHPARLSPQKAECLWARMWWGTAQEDAAFQTGWGHAGHLPREALELLLGKLREKVKVTGES